MAEYEKKVRQILKKNIVIKFRYTANDIMKQSGIDYHF